MTNISLEIPSIVENIRIVESFVDNAKEQYSLNDDLYGNIMVAVIEAVNNAIIHGNNSDKNKSVSLSVNLEEQQIGFTVSDEGPGFDYNDLPDPTAPENLESVGGRGIFLIKHLADEIEFKDEGKTIVLIFYID